MLCIDIITYVIWILADAFTSPCLYVGTNLGSCLVIVLQLPQEGEQRKTQPVIVSPSGDYLISYVHMIYYYKAVL